MLWVRKAGTMFDTPKKKSLTATATTAKQGDVESDFK
jgi:hypothetical protein